MKVAQELVIVSLTFCLALLFNVEQAESDAGRSWLPLGRNAIVEKVSDGLDGRSLDQQTLLSIYRVVEARGGNHKQLRQFQIELSKHQKFNDTVWIAGERRGPLQLYMAGQDQRIHTIKLVIPAALIREDELDLAMVAVSDLFETMFPNWEGSREWLHDSRDDIWDNFPRVSQVTEKVGSISNTALGVPSKLVIYYITTEKRCIPSFDFGRNPFKRFIC